MGGADPSCRHGGNGSATDEIFHFFSEQARKPSGIFGRFLMARIFEIGNARLNGLVYEQMAAGKDDRILEIGFGTGKLICEMAADIRGGVIEGIDFSDTMVAMAGKRNRENPSKSMLYLDTFCF